MKESKEGDRIIGMKMQEENIEWKELTGNESDKVRKLYKKEIMFNRIIYCIMFGGAIFGVLLFRHSMLDFFGVILNGMIFLIAILVCIYEFKCSHKRKSNRWESCEGELWSIERKYYIKYRIITYTVMVNDNEKGREISFDKNLVHGKVQEGDEVILLRPVGCKEINLCLKEDYDAYCEV